MKCRSRGNETREYTCEVLECEGREDGGKELLRKQHDTVSRTKSESPDGTGLLSAQPSAWLIVMTFQKTRVGRKHYKLPGMEESRSHAKKQEFERHQPF